MNVIKPTPKEDYLHVIKHTNLMSIDLIIYDKDRRVLVGKRKNKPAQGSYFIPGSRIYKSETIKEALSRSCKYELGIILENPKFRGVYEHIYSDNFVNDDFGTHYVTFSYEFSIDDKTKKHINNCSEFANQHDDYMWLTETEMLEHNNVNYYCKTYFMDSPSNKVV